MESRVFVTQVPSLRVPGGWKPKFDLSPAKRFGELLVMMEPGNATPGTAQAATDQIKDFMEEHLYTEEDYLLALGDPILIAVAAAEVVRVCGKISLLRWDARAGEYETFDMRLDAGL